MLKLPSGNLTELPGKFPETIEKQAKALQFRDELFKGRTEVKGFTIDDWDSPDLDDAIWLEKTEQGYLIQVTISDVDALVKQYSYVDMEALSRTTTHYFPAHLHNGKLQPKYSIPMLPRVLSENRLSLHEGKLRPTITVEINLGEALQILGVKISKTYLKSTKRLGLREYGHQKIIGDPGLPLRDYYQMAQKLNRKRWSEQSLAFQELKEGISTDEDGMVREGSISASNLIVQEFMVLGNQAVGALLQANRLSAPFRNHLPVRASAPTREQIIEEIETNSNYLTMVDNIRAIYSKMLGSALYEVDPQGHYGLGAEVYLHFTSPIRRYPDLVTHRVVKALIDGEKPPYSREEMTELCQYLNHRQRRLATLRATREGKNSFQNYRQYGHLLHAEKQRTPDYLDRLLHYLRDHRIGNAYFEFTASDGINIDLTCTASVRFQRVRLQVDFTARADKQAVKNQAARLLMKKVEELVSARPEQLGLSVKPANNNGKTPFENGNGSVYQLYTFCEQNNLDRPMYHYESWNGGAWPITCFCQISDKLMVSGHGESRLAAKNEAASKLLDYLQSNPRPNRSPADR
jgi:hypothetical protein